MSPPEPPDDTPDGTSDETETPDSTPGKTPAPGDTPSETPAPGGTPSETPALGGTPSETSMPGGTPSETSMPGDTPSETSMPGDTSTGDEQRGEEGPGRAGHIEAATTAWRPDRRDGIGSHPSWDDLDEEGRRQAFDQAAALRKLEAALDPEGRSTTVLAVLARIRAAGLP